MRNEIEIVDAQVHTWEPVPTRPWHPIDYGGQVKPGGSKLMAVPYDRVLHAMDAVGVDAAILYTSQDYRRPLPGGAYEYVNDYAEEAVAAHPTRFAAITHINHQAPDLDEKVAAVKKTPGTLAIRVLILDRDLAELRGGGYDRLFAAAARHSVPMIMYISGHIPDAGRVAREHPDLLLIIDHLGLRQPPLREPDDPPFLHLPELLELATLANVAVKLSGLPTLARKPYPFADLWPAIHDVMTAFGTERVMWASDYTRCLPVATYAEDLCYLLHSGELSRSERTAVLGGTARQLLGWPRPA